MNLGDIKLRVKRQFGDESGVQVTDEDIVRWVNDAMREIAMQNYNVLETVSTAAIVSGTSDYTLPDDTLKLRAIRYDDKKLDVLSLQEAEQSIIAYEQSGNYQKGTPVFAWVYANKITLYPTPDTSGASLLKIYYTRLPVEVTNNDVTVPELGLPYHPRIVEYVLQQAYEMDEDWAASGNKSAQFVSGLNVLKDAESWVEQATYPTITTLADDL